MSPKYFTKKTMKLRDWFMCLNELLSNLLNVNTLKTKQKNKPKKKKKTPLKTNKKIHQKGYMTMVY